MSAATGILTTIAGGGSDTSDGIPATAAKVSGSYIYIDRLGNIYTVSGNGGKLKKIDHLTGLISTVAGAGAPGTASGDGGPATAAVLSWVAGIKMDGANNLYIGDGYTIRKIDNTTGIITTVAGGGTSTVAGVPATAENFRSLTDFSVDAAGNIITYDSISEVVKWIDAPTGTVHFIAGQGRLTGDGVPAQNARIGIFMMYADAASGYLYFTNWDYQVRKFPFMPIVNSGITSPEDSFFVTYNKHCSGPDIDLGTPNYVAGRGVKTYFGDGATDSGAVIPGFISGGIRQISHVYNASGNYLVKHVLYQGAVAQDSVSYTYEYSFCRTLPIRLFYDNNENCIKDTGEHYSIVPRLALVDSNGITIDTLSVTSGLDYDAYCVAGDIYTFRVVSDLSGLNVTCPATGVLTDTISAATVYPDRLFGLACTSAATFDLQVYGLVVAATTSGERGEVYVRNSTCYSSDATVTVNFSPKYILYPDDVTPTPSSYTSTSISWNLTGLSVYDSSPTNLYFLVRNSSAGRLPLGDTVWTGFKVTPISGDANPTNNYLLRLDTIVLSHDPNEMSVSPSGCLGYSTVAYPLQYTIAFCNTGNDTAYNIVVYDTLNDNIDPSSLRIVNASATMNIEHIKSGGFNIVKFSFPNINLLDSSHHGQCTGSVIFNVNTIPNLADGSSIYNEAGIYFDYNPVVMTNQVENTTGCWPESTPQIKNPHTVTIFPNPATNELNIKIQSNEFDSYTITNNLGSVVLSSPISSPTTKLSIKALPAGIYYIRLTGDSRVEVRKFVKM